MRRILSRVLILLILSLCPPVFNVVDANDSAEVQTLKKQGESLQPGGQQYLTDRYTAFRQRLGDALTGEALAKKYDIKKLAAPFTHGKLSNFLKSQGEQELHGTELISITCGRALLSGMV